MLKKSHKRTMSKADKLKSQEFYKEFGKNLMVNFATAGMMAYLYVYKPGMILKNVVEYYDKPYNCTQKVIDKLLRMKLIKINSHRSGHWVNVYNVTRGHYLQFRKVANLDE